MDGLRLDARAVQVARHAVGAVLGAGEDQRLMHVALLDDLGEQRLFLGFFDKIDLLLDLIHRLGRRGDRDMLGIAEHALRKRGDLLRDGRRKQQRLPLGGQVFDDALDVREKAHIQHAVGLVQHKALHAVELDDALPHQIPQAAGRGDQDIRAALDRLDLRHLRDAAIDHSRGARRIPGVLAHVFIDLQRKLARRRQDERADRAGLAARLVQPLDDRHGKRAGLARAGLCAAQQVAAGEHGRDGALLDRGGLLVARLAQCAQNVLLYLQFIEFHSADSFPSSKFARCGKSRLPESARL